MSGSKKLWLLFVVVFSTIFFNVSLITDVGAESAPSLFIAGPSQMSVNQTATLTVSGGCGGPYTWSLSGGGYLSATTGDSVNYTAPSSNPNCNLNPLISVTDKAGQIVYK